MPKPLTGRAIEDLVEAFALLTGRGRITSSRPSSDVDHKDFIFDERGGYLSIYLQVKGVTQVSVIGQVRMSVRFRKRRLLSSPRFLYLFVLVDPKTVRLLRMWLIPSEDFNRMAPRTKAPTGYEVLAFVAGERSKWDGYLIQPEELGVRLLKAMEATKGTVAITGPIPASLVMRANPQRASGRVQPRRRARPAAHGRTARRPLRRAP